MSVLPLTAGRKRISRDSPRRAKPDGSILHGTRNVTGGRVPRGIASLDIVSNHPVHYTRRDICGHREDGSGSLPLAPFSKDWLVERKDLLKMMLQDRLNFAGVCLVGNRCCQAGMANDPRKKAATWSDRCDVRCHGLVKLAGGAGGGDSEAQFS